MEPKLDIPKKILIVGAGMVGTSLYRALSPLYTAKVHLYGRLECLQRTGEAL